MPFEPAIRNDAPRRILRRRQVQERTGLARSTLYLYMKNGDFPKPCRLGPQTVGWLESEINAWIEDRMQGRPTRS
jgi:prophage regulatory protein